ncbi:hypothetical protein HO996_12070 [Streptococcus suis]|nr:hypothetical protein [Streptococcus suis]
MRLLAEPVEVKNPDKLSDAEKEAVKDAVKESNDLPEGTEITVSDNGTVTVTYHLDLDDLHYLDPLELKMG